MKKNGFTLIELLGVIVLIGIIALITVPTVDTVIKKGKQKAYDLTKDTIITAAKNWLTDNKSLFDDGDTLTLTLADLKEQGYLDFNIKNPSSSTCLDNTMEVSVTRDGKKFNYAIVDEELVDGTEADCEAVGRAPSIYLLGNNPINVEINSVFTDPGAVATDTDGNDISNKIIKTGTVDTSTPIDNLKYKYTIIVDGITKTVARKINVVDNTAPVITGANNTSLIDTVTSYDLMAGVSATDNSGEAVNVVVKGNLSLGVIGKYTITYIATDSSGNTATVTRIITVYSSCFAFDSSTGTITGYTWNNTAKCPMDVVIPSEIVSVPVRYISSTAFDGTGKPNKLTSVDFSVADNLLEIKSGTTRYVDGTTYYDGAFEENNISSVDFSNNITNIGTYAFYNNLIENINLSNSNKLENLGNSSFGNNVITNVSFPKSIVTIGYSAFYNNNIATLVLDNYDNLTSILSSAFSYNDITNLQISNCDNLTEIYGFSYNKIQTATLTNLPSVTIIGDFYNNYNLQSFDFTGMPNLINISSMAFLYNFALKSINLTGLTKLENIYASAFYNCSLTSLNTSSLSNLKNIGSSGGTSTWFFSEPIEYGAFYGNDITSLDFSNNTNLQKIGIMAFAGNKITSINFGTGSNINLIDSGAFANNKLPDANAYIYARNTDGSIDNTILSSYGGITKTTTIPSSIVTIKPYAFYEASMSSVNFSSATNLKEIGKGSFYRNLLTGLALPEGVLSIGTGAFGYNSLASLSLPSTLTLIDKAAFNKNNLPAAIATIYGRNADGTINNTNIVSYGGREATITVPSGVLKISKSAYADNNYITEINIPNSVTTIEYDAFTSVYNLGNINIDNTVDAISGSPWLQTHTVSNYHVVWLR